MSKRTFQLLVVWLIAGVLGAASDPFVGKWKLDPARSKLTDRMKIEAAGANKYAITFGGATDADVIVADGTDQAGMFGTTLSITVEQPDAWTVVRKMNGRALITAKWKLSSDGQTFSDALKATQPDGSTFSMDLVYKRTAPGSGFVGTWESTSETVNTAFEVQIQPYEGDGLTFNFPAEQRTQSMKFDGKDYPAVGPTVVAGSTASGRRVNERTLEVTAKIKDKIVGTQEITISPDLKVLTITLRPAGQSKPNILVFDRD